MTLTDRLLEGLEDALSASKPIARWRRVLAERQYSAPTSMDQAVMDLYALYALYWEEGSGREAYGYPQTAFGHSRKTRIDRTFEEAVYQMAEFLVREGRTAVASEIAHMFDPDLIDPPRVAKWVRRNAHFAERIVDLANMAKRGEIGPEWDDFAKEWWDRFNYSDTTTILSAPFWRGRLNNFGGPPWVKIAVAVQNIDAALRNGAGDLKGTQKLMNAIDVLWDLEHNTGALATKFSRPVQKSTLDSRAGFKTPADFAPYVSSQVKQLIRA